MIVKPPAEGMLASVRALGAGRRAPPVHLWNPPYCGEIDMRIARDGTWFHEGTPIGRPGLVKLFSSILRREGDRYFLVTPVEKVGIRVDDAPMLAIDFTVTGTGCNQSLHFVTKTEDEATMGPGHPLRVASAGPNAEPAPYILIRPGLEALIDRKSFYRMIELGCHETVGGEGWIGLWSQGTFFPVIPSAELPS